MANPSRYFAVEIVPSLNCGYIENSPALPLVGLGERVDDTDLALPVRLTIRSKSPLELQDYYDDKAVMSTRFLALLQTHGIQNLQVFPLVLTNSGNGQEFTTHSIVNVIGSARLQGVKVTPPVDNPDALLFALGHGLVAEEQLAQAIQAAGFRNIELTPL